MNRCTITYERSPKKYSEAGLKRLARGLKHLEDLPYSAEEQVKEAALRASKMSVQGVQPKLSACLRVKKGAFEIVNRNGRFILKPQNFMFSRLPENEDLTMRMAKAAGLEVPLHGLIYAADGSMTYFIRRFDRQGRGLRLALEDFAQLMGFSRETKYDSSMEKVADVIEQFCTFPAIEKSKLFRLTLFNFLVGNEDMHLKNFSLLTSGNVTGLSPAYDLLNTTIALSHGAGSRPPVEEMALPLAGKRRKLTGKLLLDYYGRERLKLNDKIIEGICENIRKVFPVWQALIDICFLPDDLKGRYRALLWERKKILGI
ncbi:MAG: HipA domain-containing protein [bacterium]|nr:HipA domain-containing protein [bacterium]